MANSSLVRKIMAISPHVEMCVRYIYWKNIKLFLKRKKKVHSKQSPSPIDFCKITDYLIEQGVCSGGLLLVHSAFTPFKGRGKTPNELLDMLLDLVGEQGTLAMPAMPKFKNSPETTDYLTQSLNNEVYHYDVKTSSVKTGALPFLLHKREGSKRSRYPINTMVAKGPLASKLFKSELSGNSPLACGINSSWKKCIDNDAIIIGLGTDLAHSLTAIHVAEDVLDDVWPVSNWYIKKTFRITDDTFDEKMVLRERAPKWGALHYAERTLCKDLLNEGLLKSTYIDGILVEVIRSKALLTFLESKNSTGYPYYWV